MGSGVGGPSQRQLRVGEVIRQRLAEVLARDDLEANILKKNRITVTEVRITPDLRRASVYVMPLGGMHLSEIVAKLNVEAPRLKVALGGLHLKYVPDIKFIADESFDRVASIWINCWTAVSWRAIWVSQKPASTPTQTSDSEAGKS